MEALLGFPLLELLFCGCLVCGPDGRRSERKRLKDRIVVHCTVFAVLCCCAVSVALVLHFHCRRPETLFSCLFSFFSLIFLSLNPTQFKSQRTTHSSTLLLFYPSSSTLLSFALSATPLRQESSVETHTRAHGPSLVSGKVSGTRPDGNVRCVATNASPNCNTHSSVCSIQHGGNTANTGI